MNTFKRMLALMLALIMVFSFAACGEDKPAEDNKEENNAAEENKEPMTEEEELEAMQNEPAYAEGFTFFESGGCTSAPFMASARLPCSCSRLEM